MDIIVVILFIWHIIGLAFGCCFNASGFEYVNPYWIYEHYQVNRFGSTLVCIMFNLICPIASICYWIYKLCTVGRSK